jgi:uncharacterized protein YjiK
MIRKRFAALTTLAVALALRGCSQDGSAAGERGPGAAERDAGAAASAGSANQQVVTDDAGIAGAASEDAGPQDSGSVVADAADIGVAGQEAGGGSDCPNHWTGADCDQCPDDEINGHWDPQQDCNACLPGFFGADCRDCSFPLSSYARSQSVTLSEIPAEASGIAYNRDTGTFFVVANRQGAIWEYDQSLQTLLRTIALENLDTDTEGLAYLGDGWLAICAETNLVYVAQVDETTTRISGSDGAVQVYQPCAAPPVTNAGLEGIAYRPPLDGAPGRFFACQEHSPMRVLGFDHVLGSEPFELRSYADGTLVVGEPWDAEQALGAEVTDLAGMAYDPISDTLLIVSQESSRILRVDPDTGATLQRLDLTDTSTSEGIALFGDCKLAVVSEPNRVDVFSAAGE